MDKEEAKLILKIQEIDLDIERINKRIKAIKEEAKRLEEQLSSLYKEKELLLKRKEELENLKKQLREEIKEAEEKLEKTEEKLTKVTRDVEYKALLRERAKLEDTILKKSYELDEIEREIEKLAKEIEEKVPKLEREIRHLEEELKDLELEEKVAHEKLHEYAQKREETKKEMPEHILRFYESAKEHYEGFVVVPVEEEACSGCGIKIPNVLLTKMLKENSIEQCPSCGRFIYYKL